MIGCWFFDRLTSRNDAVFVLLRGHIYELQPSIRLARDWQDFICPYLRTTIDSNICSQSPAVGFMRRQLVDQFPLMRLDEGLQLTFS
jgi:hypothetical protein